MKRTKWIYWIKVVASLVFLVILYQRVNSRESVIDALQRADWRYVAGCLLLLVVNVGLAFIKWRFLLRKNLPAIANGAVFGSLMFGYTLGLVTPGRLGELGRGLFFESRDRLMITGLNVLDKLTNQVVFFSLGCLSILLLMTHSGLFGNGQLLALLLPGGILIALLWLLLFNPQRVHRWLLAWAGKRGTSSKLHSLASALNHFTRRDSLLVLGMSTSWVLVICLQYHLLVRAFVPVDILDSLQAVSATLFIKTLLPISFGDLGIRESVAIFCYAPFGVPEVPVFSASLLIFFINFLLPSLLGLYYLFQVKGRADGAEEAEVTAGVPGKSTGTVP